MRALIVYKKSMFQLYTVDRENPRVQALLARGDRSVRALRPGHEAHISALDAAHRALKAAGFSVSRTYRAKIGDVSSFDLVVTVGGDGTLLDVSHHLDARTPLLGVNSDSERSVGLLAAATPETLPGILDQIRARRVVPIAVTRLRLELDGARLPLLALNDALVVHRNPASTSRYHITLGRRGETHKSSGLWIASPIGSTAAIRSAGGQVQDVDDDRLQFRVREPYLAGPRHELLSGLPSPRQVLKIHSTMRDGRIYIDGPHVCYPFGLGAKLRVHAAPRSLLLYLTAENLRRRRAYARRR